MHGAQCAHYISAHTWVFLYSCTCLHQQTVMYECDICTKKIATAHTMKRHRRDKIHDAEDDESRNEDEESNDDNNEAGIVSVMRKWIWRLARGALPIIIGLTMPIL